MTTLKELIAEMRAAAPANVGKLDDAVLISVMRHAMATVARLVVAAPVGVHKVQALGVFRVRMVEPKGEGKPGGRRVIFNPASPKGERKRQAAAGK